MEKSRWLWLIDGRGERCYKQTKVLGAQARHCEATATIAVPGKKCQSGAFSAEQINGKWHLVASHNRTKGWDRDYALRPTAERTKTD